MKYNMTSLPAKYQKEFCAFAECPRFEGNLCAHFREESNINVCNNLTSEGLVRSFLEEMVKNLEEEIKRELCKRTKCSCKVTGKDRWCIYHGKSWCSLWLDSDWSILESKTYEETKLKRKMNVGEIDHLIKEIAERWSISC